MRLAHALLLSSVMAVLVMKSGRAAAQLSYGSPPARPPAATAMKGAAAERAPDRSPTDAPRWYGWQTLIADGLSLALLPVAVGAPMFLLLTPVIHGVHGRLGVAFFSGAMRTFGTVVPVLLWFASSCTLDLGFATDEPEQYCDSVLPTWLAIGMVGSVIVDAALAYDPTPSANSAALGVFPWLRASGEAGIGLGARF